MRAYTIDSLTPEQSTKITELLEAMELGSGIEGVFWLPIPEHLHSPLQKEHLSSCGPYVMAIDVEKSFVQLEFLVRARNALRCDCVCYASPELEQYMMRYVDGLFTQSNIAL